MQFVDIHTHTPVAHHEVIRLQNFNIGMADPEPAFNTLFSVGIHPWFTGDSALALYQLRQFAALPNCLAIGECGLDKVKGAPWVLQLDLFETQISLAEELKKPMVLHVVKAFDVVLQLKKSSQPKQPWVIHGFDKHPDTALQLQKQGVYISLGTRLLQQPERLIALWESIDHSLVFLETDTSTLHIEQVYHAVSELVGVSVDALKQQIWTNFQRIFPNH